ncbi:subtilase [Colletotrichum cereale]|nr:subtilase [Colletotrichum cereale]
MDTIVNDAGIPSVWNANLTPDQLAKVKADPVVAAVDTNDPISLDELPDSEKTLPPATRHKRDEISQKPIAKNDIFDLRTLSTPPRVKDTLPDYRFDDFAGQGITVYVIDGGPFELGHQEFVAPSADVTRRELNTARSKKVVLEDTQHGTCVASKVVGVTTGVAKRANLVGVRIDVTNFGLLRGLQAAANDIKAKGLRGKAVVTTSISMREDNAIYISSMRSVIRGLINLDVPVVASAGNQFLNGAKEPDGLPAIMVKEFPIIVVGSADRDFKFTDASQRGNLVTTFAIGDAIRCADSRSQTNLAVEWGTSFAAPQVAGMVAYWMSHPEFALNLGAPGKVSETLRNITGALSYQRVLQAEFPPIAWNGHDLAESCALPKSGTGRRVRRDMRRDLAQACSFAPTSAATGAPTASAPTGSAPTGKAPTGSVPTGSASTSAAPDGSAPTGSSPVPPPLPSAPGSAACNLCGAELSSDAPGNLGGQVGCQDAEVARSACAANDACKSWAFGNENRGTNTVPVCLLFTDSATKIVNQAPADPEGKCPFRYNDKACPSS